METAVPPPPPAPAPLSAPSLGLLLPLGSPLLLPQLRWETAVQIRVLWDERFPPFFPLVSPLSLSPLSSATAAEIWGLPHLDLAPRAGGGDVQALCLGGPSSVPLDKLRVGPPFPSWPLLPAAQALLALPHCPRGSGPLCWASESSFTPPRSQGPATRTPDPAFHAGPASQTTNTGCSITQSQQSPATGLKKEDVLLRTGGRQGLWKISLPAEATVLGDPSPASPRPPSRKMRSWSRGVNLGKAAAAWKSEAGPRARAAPAVIMTVREAGATHPCASRPRPRPDAQHSSYVFGHACTQKERP